MSTSGKERGAPEWAARLRIGASGFSFPDWSGPFYPKGLARSEYLKYYASRFPTVEVNSTYYRVPPARTFALMAAKTPPGFLFTVKAHQDMTHHRERDPAVYRAFLEAIQPLEAARKFDGVVLQFPFGFRNDPAARSHLAFLREHLPGMRLWAEFRHESWATPATLEFLRDLSIGFVAVDEPDLPGLFPPWAAVTSDAGYVRFHGRNRETWWNGGDRRYDWEYTAAELEEWLDRIRSMAEASDHTYVFFNNCYMGRAVKGARLLRKLLGLETELELEF